jgi:acetyl-CoA carboxylase carboxyltransferase component
MDHSTSHQLQDSVAMPADHYLELQARRPGATRVSYREFGGVPTVCVEVDAHEDGVGLGHSDGDLLAHAAEMARERKLPLVAFASAAASEADAGVEALDAWGRTARALTHASGVVPMILCVTGPIVGGPALLLGLVDVVIMVADTYAYVTGPRAVQAFTGVPVDRQALGGSGLHARTSGVASIVVPSLAEANDVIADLLGYLPPSTDQLPPRRPTADPVDRDTTELAAILPHTTTGSYDVRTIAAGIVDDSLMMELGASWATNLVTALGAIGGQPVGIVANQPQSLAGTLDIAASQKGARFVAFCDAFNLALITLVDTPGFYPGKDLEWRGMIRHGAQLAFAFARATVPRVNLTLRKSYGGAYIVMDSKHMGNDISYAWPSAEIAVMGAKGAVEILHRRASPEERERLEEEYEHRLLNPYRAAERGSIDAVIDPADTRRAIAAALDVLATKRERLRARTHDNTPL